MAKYNEGDKVEWNWGNGKGTGTVQSRFTKKVTRKIDGEEITRDGDDDNAALYIDSDDGNNVLKLESEVKKAS
jgi:hypothetical protein